MKKILFILFCIVCVITPTQANKKANKTYQKYKKAILEREWISFSMDNCNVICKNENGNCVLFATFTEYLNVLITTDSIFIIDKVSDEFTKFSRNSKFAYLDVANYSNIGDFNVYSNIIDRNAKYDKVKTIDINGVKYDRFFSKNKLILGYCGVKFLSNGKTELIARPGDTIRECHTYSYYFFNKNTKLLDSVYSENYDKVYGKSTNSTKATNFSFENRQKYIDSVFNLANPKYELFDICNEDKLPLSTKNMSKITDSTKLDSIFLNQPLVNIYNDTLYFRNTPKVWRLINFCINGCKPCYKQLLVYQKEQDSLGYRVLEHLGIKIYCINPTTNHLYLLKKITDLYNIQDISYCSKGITRTSNFGNSPEYVLISPDNTIVYKTTHLTSDYSALLKAKADYEKQHNLKP